MILAPGSLLKEVVKEKMDPTDSKSRYRAVTTCEEKAKMAATAVKEELLDEMCKTALKV